jgi:hypothetical protein
MVMDLLVPLVLLAVCALGLFMAFFGTFRPRMERAWRLWVPGIAFLLIGGIVLGFWSQAEDESRTVWPVLLISETIVLLLVVQSMKRRRHDSTGE